ncbi:MAG: hydrolase [Clostridia bacterium]|nr:hydrolase [Clostridia bacterium]
MTPLDYKKKFIAIYNAKIKREGADKLLEFLEGSDFFTAPASTRYHGSHEGGLCEHSINVYECLCDYMARPRVKELYGMNYSDESIAIVSLLHDVCKTNFYVETTRNVKENGVWKTVPYYSIDDQLPYGHGEKSVYMISAYMKLTRDEAFAIRYHMGFAECGNQTYINNVGKAYEMFPIAFAVSVADMEASYYLEESGQ